MIGTTFLGGFSAALLPLGLLGSAGPAAGSYLRSYLRSPQDSGEQTALPLSRSAAPARDLRPRPPGELEIVVASPVSELVIVDSAVQDRAVLQRALKPGVQMVEIDASRPGLPQLVQALASFKNLSAIHVVSHAEAGVLLLGSSRITAESVKGEIESLAALRNAVRPGGDLLFYGCDLAATPEGEQLLDIVQHATQLDVAASSNATGNLAQGGDWQLEVRRGHVDTQLAFSDKALADFSGVLLASDGPKSFSSFSVNSLDLVQTDFRVSAWDSTHTQLGLQIYSAAPFAAYIQNGGTATGTYFYLRADDINTTKFELTGLSAGEYGAVSQFTNVRIVGMLASGGTVTSSTINGSATPGEAFTFTATQLADFSGKKLKGFKLYVDCGGDGGACPANKFADFEFRGFTIAGAQNSPRISIDHISLTGATGTGGAFKIGDTVTARWNNTASGDYNATPITGVNFDLSQFGGGASVAALNSAGIWTATHLLSAGAIDATNRNVSVTASNSNGPATTAGTNNATVDTIAPVVTPGNIALSGASGVGGAFKAGDTVTAQWNNTAAGDNNTDTISAVTINLSAFNGPVAVPATNAAGIWTATHPLPAGVAGNNLNASISAADNAGNITTTASTANATVDTLIPTVSSIAVSGSPAPGDASVAFTATFNKPVINISTDDFTLIGTGTASGTISSVSASTGSSVNVNVSGITGTGTIKINLNGSTNIADSVGNGPPASFNSGGTHTVAVPVAPGAPTGATATAGNAQASITFAAPASNGGSAISTYNAVASGGGGQTGYCTGPTACTITVPGLTNGISYSFNVTATNSAGLTGPAATSNNVTPQGTQTISFAPAASYNFGTTPTLTATSSAGASYPVSFTSSTPGVCTITPTGSLTFVTAGTCTIAADQAGDAAISAAPQVTQSFAVNAIAPDIPVIGTVTAADAQATVNFTASVGSGGAPISGYTVTATPVAVPGAPSVTTQTGPTSPIVVTGLTNGFVYNFTVKATNGAQTSADSAAVQATPRKLELVGAPGSVPGMAGTPTATLSGGGATCTLQATGGFGPAASTPPGLQAPNGQFAFTAEQCTGAVTMTLVYPSPLPVGVQFRKPDGAGGWFDPTNAATSLNVVLNAARTTVSYTITDNGLGDTNPATGSVSDPFVPVVAAVAPGGAQAIPSLGGWALAMLSGLLGGLALRSRKVFTARR